MKRRTAEEIAGKQFAYSTFEVKAVDEEKREIEGWATTPDPDRLGDIVEPEGAQFKLPLPLLWQHNSRQPVGEVIEAKVTKSGIKVRVRLAKLGADAPQALKERIDEAWHSVKSKLVKAFSIGFRSLEHSEMKDTWAYRFLKWEWLELSLVTIPANSECTITAIKSADQRVRAALGAQPTRVVRLDTSPGASGTSIQSKKETEMKTIKEQIEALENKRAALVARQKEVQDKALNEGRTKDAAEKEEFATVTADIKAIDEELVDLRAMAEQELRNPTPVQRAADPDSGAAARDPQQRGESAVVFSRSNLEPGVRFARYAQALIRGGGNLHHALQCALADQRWMRETPEIATVLKTAVAAGDTTTAGWASELVYAQNLANEFIEYLRPMTILGKITNFRRVPFNIRVGGASAGTTGYWVGQGKPIPVSKPTTTSVSLAIAKAAGLVAIDNELARLSTPSAELMVRNDLRDAIVYLLDDSFINPNNGGVSNVSPASMTYGVTPVTPTGTTYATLRTDLQTLMETAFDNNINTDGSVWIMSQTLANKLAMMVNALDQRVSPNLSAKGGEFMGYPAIVSQAAQISGSPQYNDILVWLHANEVFMADDGQITVEASREASIQLDDAPTNASVGVTATTMVSMFQTETMAIKAVRYINWTKRRAQAAQWIQAAAYVG